MLAKTMSSLGVIISLVIPGLSEAATFNVANGDDFQAALSTAASNGQSDTINMASGTYNGLADGPFVYNAGENQALTIIGDANGGTIIDGGDTVRGLFIDTATIGNPNDANSDITIQNVTFQNGFVRSNNSPIIFRNGGGLQVSTNMGAILLEGCLFQENLAEEFMGVSGTAGGAFLETESGEAIVQNCRFENNTASTAAGGLSMGSTTGNLTLEQSIFMNNQTTLNGTTGGARLQTGGSINVLGNNFLENSATSLGGGLGVIGADVVVENNIFNENESDGIGGGLLLTTAEDSSATLTNNVFGFNRVLSQGSFGDMGGGGLLILSEHNLNADLVNNTFFGNSAERGGGITIFLTNDNSSVEIINSIIFGNVASLTGDDLFLFDDADNLLIPDSENGTGSEVTIRNSDFTEIISACNASATCTDNVLLSDNIDADPLFVDFSTNDFHLTENSPCIDAGINQSNLPTEDLDGNPRPVGAAPDMGAFEFGSGGGGGGCSLIR